MFSLEIGFPLQHSSKVAQPISSRLTLRSVNPLLNPGHYPTPTLTQRASKDTTPHVYPEGCGSSAHWLETHIWPLLSDRLSCDWNNLFISLSHLHDKTESLSFYLDVLKKKKKPLLPKATPTRSLSVQSVHVGACVGSLWVLRFPPTIRRHVH